MCTFISEEMLFETFPPNMVHVNGKNDRYPKLKFHNSLKILVEIA